MWPRFFGVKPIHRFDLGNVASQGQGPAQPWDRIWVVVIKELEGLSTERSIAARSEAVYATLVKR
jgi:hypothetical protein